MSETSSLHQQLNAGLEVVDTLGRSVTYRYLRASDDLVALTDLLHEAYAPLAAAGMRFVASHQDVATTQRRVAEGDTIVAVEDGCIIGTVTLAGAEATGGSSFCDRSDVAGFGQFAVLPAHQRRGIGRTLERLVERRAREGGVAQLVLNTSVHAVGLIALYEAWGFHFVEYVQWPGVNYRSVVMAKALAHAA